MAARGRTIWPAALALIGCCLQASASDDDEPFAAAPVLDGTVISEAECKADHHVWVEPGGAGECIRFYLAHGGANGRAPLIFLEGDVLFQRSSPLGSSQTAVAPRYTRYTPRMIQGEADQRARAGERPFVNMARPGTFGSSGRHRERRREREVALVNAAIDALVQRFGWNRINLAGLSGGGHLVAALMARRADIGCAVIASGNVAVRERLRLMGRAIDVTGYTDFVDPIDHVGEVARRPPKAVIVLTDPRDRVVAAASQFAYVAALRAAGVAVEHRLLEATDTGHHILRSQAIDAGLACSLDP